MPRGRLRWWRRGFRRSATFNPMVDLFGRPAQPCAMPDPLDAIFAALADPTRRAILALLLEDDMAVTDVAAAFPVSLAAVSKHLGVLAAAGLIAQEKRGRITWCKLEPDGLKAASVWMQGFGQFEPVNLDAFERFLAAELEGSELDEAAPPGEGSPQGREATQAPWPRP